MHDNDECYHLTDYSFLAYFSKREVFLLLFTYFITCATPISSFLKYCNSGTREQEVSANSSTLQLKISETDIQCHLSLELPQTTSEMIIISIIFLLCIIRKE